MNKPNIQEINTKQPLLIKLLSRISPSKEGHSYKILSVLLHCKQGTNQIWRQ